MFSPKLLRVIENNVVVYECDEFYLNSIQSLKQSMELDKEVRREITYYAEKTEESNCNR